MKKTDNPRSAVIRACGRLMLLSIGIGFVLRIALAAHPITVASSLSLWQWMGVFLIGIVNDFCVTALMLIPLVGFWMSSGHWKLRSPQCYMFMGAIALLWCWVTFGCKQLHDFNGGLARVVSGIILLWLATFALRTFVPSIRRGWMKSITAILLFIYVFVPVFNACGEWLFWNEFGVRYNFIAVDYLVYTSEVVGNIMQSYSTGWIIAGVIIAAIGIEWLLLRHTIAASATFHQPGWRPRTALTLLPYLVAAAVILPLTGLTRQSDNQWYNELQANGIYSFGQAFFDNKLEYTDFYITVPESEAADVLSYIESAATDSALVARYPNIVLITMESMSADYMQRFGNSEGLTPTLDSLWNRSIAFESMFAAGNRTVRGLEALVMSRPPSPGESIIKRPTDNSQLPSIVPTLLDNGYNCRFYYGGDSYFDNMESFFSRLGYNIYDRKTMAPEDITCQTVWGVCDGDVYRRLIADLDSAYASGTRVFAHVLTTSNHRPYIYPEGCVSIPPSQKSRKGAVMYSDYALGKLIEETQAKPWADSTVFVIVADHCASSAGSTELPLANYHIPALIYAPSLLKPMTVTKTASQVDLIPTLFAMLGWQQPKGIYGRDILSPTFTERAYLATYQDLGYLSGDTLTILSPGRKSRQYKVTPSAADPYAMEPIDPQSPSTISRAAAQYQSSATALK